MKNEESMRSIIATPGFQERSDKDFLKDFLGFLAKGNNTYPAAVENSSF